MDLWWRQRSLPHATFTYLPFEVLFGLDDQLKGTNGNDCVATIKFTGGRYHAIYGPLIPLLPHRKVCFVLIRNLDEMRQGASQKRLALQSPNHFFTVAFDYDNHRAYSFGAFSKARSSSTCKPAADSTWDRWCGMELWRGVAQGMGWEDSLLDIDKVQVVSKEWKQVRRNLPCTIILLTCLLVEWL
jgi:hypothetical protein